MSYILPFDKLPNDWKQCFDEYGKENLQKIQDFLNNEAKEGKHILPRPENVFRAFEMTPFSNVRVVQIGQDCYHRERTNKITNEIEPEATGLCFSVNKGIQVPPSLKTIFKELERDPVIHFTRPNPEHGCLDHWSKQGNFAKAKLSLISLKSEHKNKVLQATHPSPLARGGFIGCGNFSSANKVLDPPIDWNLDSQEEKEKEEKEEEKEKLDMKKKKVVVISKATKKLEKHIEKIKILIEKNEFYYSTTTETKKLKDAKDKILELYYKLNV